PSARLRSPNLSPASIVPGNLSSRRRASTISHRGCCPCVHGGDRSPIRRGKGQAAQWGQTISQFDLAIAATALQHGMILLSENRKHYERIPNLKLESLKTNS